MPLLKLYEFDYDSYFSGPWSEKENAAAILFQEAEEQSNCCCSSSAFLKLKYEFRTFAIL